jgi:hypothetical protein
VAILHSFVVLATLGSFLSTGSVLVQVNRYNLLHKMQDANGLGLEAVRGEDYCRVEIIYPSDTVSKWVSAC